jgi:MFS transporter, DHA1 family, multidrug resistance protein
MEARQPTATDTPFSSASTATVDEIPDAEKGNMPIDPASDVLSQELEKGEPVEPVGSKLIIDVNDSLVEFDGPDDPENPRNWSKAKRWGITLSMGLMTFVVSLPFSGLLQLHIADC